MGIRDKPIAPRSPWQNGFAERLIGSIRRECVDHVVALGEAVGGDCFRLVLPPERQLVPARASASESRPPLPPMPRARPRTPLHLRGHPAECLTGGHPSAEAGPRLVGPI